MWRHQIIWWIEVMGVRGLICHTCVSLADDFFLVGIQAEGVIKFNNIQVFLSYNKKENLNQPEDVWTIPTFMHTHHTLYQMLQL